MRSPVSQLDRSLGALAAILRKAEAHAEARGVDPAVLLADRLFPDMLPLVAQVQTCCDHAKNGCHRLAGLEPPRFADNETTFAELQDRIARTRAAIAAIPDAAFADAEGREVMIRRRATTLSGTDYAEGSMIPNVYFHLTVAYAILRHDGVEVGKADFLGFGD